MKRILICTSVLGGGTALVFAAAALAATIAPAGQLVPGNSQQAQMFGGIRGGADTVRGLTKVTSPDGSVTLQIGPINNFGLINGMAGTGVVIANDLVAVPPVIDQPLGTEAP
jgi:hypothetical protein